MVGWSVTPWWGGGGYMLVYANLLASGSKSPPRNEKYSTLIFLRSNFLPCRTHS
jgi:hypothetical protein